MMTNYCSKSVILVKLYTLTLGPLFTVTHCSRIQVAVQVPYFILVFDLASAIFKHVFTIAAESMWWQEI